MNQVSRLFFLALVLGALSPASRTLAGPLPLDGNAIPGYHGTSLPFFSSLFGNTMSASVEFAVYAPGQFNLSFGAGADPSAGSDFVYAYQLYNTGLVGNSTLSILTVGLNANNQATNIGTLPLLNGVYGQFPDNSSFGGSPATSARWSYNPNNLPLSAATQILLSTSPHGPTSKLGSVQGGGLGNSQLLPTPVPEPATFVLGMCGAVLLAALRKSFFRK